MELIIKKNNIFKKNKMDCFNNKNIVETEQRKLYVDLLQGNGVAQPEDFCSNKIKTTKFTL